MGLVLITPPAVEPISTAAAKLHLRVDHADEDTLIDRLIRAARIHVEEITGRALITQTWEYREERFPYYASEPIKLGRSPLQTIISVKYYNGAGVLTTVSAADYFADVSLLRGEVTLAYGASWPATRYQRNAVAIQFVAGYGDNAEDVPEDLTAAMLLHIGHLYANREAFITGTIIQSNPATDALIGPKIVSLIA